jgi:hypothetical protein
MAKLKYDDLLSKLRLVDNALEIDFNDTTVAAELVELKNALDQIINPLLFIDSISDSGDFPTSIEVQNGWFYTILADVTDDDPTKTNTGESFVMGMEIAWNGITWVQIGSHKARAIVYNNTSSGLGAENVQAAIDEVAFNVGSSTGIITLPSFNAFDDSGTPKITIGAFDVKAYSDNNFNLPLNTFSVTESTYTLIDQSINYIVFNGATQLVEISPSRDNINQSSIIPVASVYVDLANVSNQFYILDWDELAKGLPNKIVDRLVRTSRFDVETNGLNLTESVGRIINISDGYVWAAATRYYLTTVNSDSAHCKLYYHSSGEWTYTDITQYNNTQYDDGTDLQPLSSLQRYAVNWIFVSVSGSPCIAIVLGRGNYNLSGAESSSLPSVPDLIATQFILVGRIIVRKDQESAQSVQSSFDFVFNRAPVTSHNELSNRDAIDSHPASAIAFSNVDMVADNVKDAIDELHIRNNFVTPPIAQDSTGVVGQWSYDSNYFYKCVATDTWVRTAVESTWS